MVTPSHRRARWAAPLVAAAGLVAAVVLVPAPAHAAVLFSDNFEQPTLNVWLGGSAGNWSVVTEDGSRVYRQTSTALAPTVWAGSGSGPGTVLTGRVKPTTPLYPPNLIGVAGRVANPSNLYYVGLRGANLEIGQQSWGQNVVLASVPFAATVGTWYTLSLSFLVAGTVTGSAVGPGGTTATVSAADPGGPQVGDRVGFFTRTATASFDDIRLTNSLPEPTPPVGTCPVVVTMKVGVVYGTVFTSTLTLTNISSAPVAPPWTITWRFAPNQFMQSLFNAGWYQVGQTVTVTNATWFPALPPGATSVTMGFTAGIPVQAPTNVTFNGLPCSLSFS